MRKNEEQAKKLLKRFNNEVVKFDDPILKAVFGGNLYKSSITEFVIDPYFEEDNFIKDIIIKVVNTGCKVAHIVACKSYRSYKKIKTQNLETFQAFEYDDLIKEIEEICEREEFDFIVIDTLMFFHFEVDKNIKEIRELMQKINQMNILHDMGFIFFNTISTIVRKNFSRKEATGLTSTRFIPDTIIFIEPHLTLESPRAEKCWEVKIKKSRFATDSCFKIYYIAEKGIDEILTYIELLTKLVTKYNDEEVYYIQKINAQASRFIFNNKEYNCKTKKELYKAVYENLESIKKEIPWEAFLCC